MLGLQLGDWKYTFLMLMLFELIIISVHMFSQGFLLTRDAITLKSSCNDFQIFCSRTAEASNGAYSRCKMQRFRKTVVLIIDALRYDFVTYDTSLKKKHEKPFQNKMKAMHSLLISKPRQSLLLKFISDPPTTTMQRLKGLTTGSLPTFIDASHNFASSEILEDNIIDQMKENGINIVALGDDTWKQLYPNRFHRSFFFPSFNVMDLDTVDNGILAHLLDEVRAPDADFIIAHFLGVDHCGHAYGPNHPQMAIKLSQMNEVIRNVSKLMDKDSLLVVIGDHGMTSTGDHGGDSKDEIETTLFMYSPGFTLPPVERFSKFVYQIDFVPTISALVGIPIPFSNLGKVLENVVVSNDNLSCSSQDALYSNFQQIKRYIHAYQEINGELPQSLLQSLLSIAQAVNETHKEYDKRELFINYITFARDMCEQIWAKFSVVNILLGLISLLCIILIIFNMLPRSKSMSYSIVYHFRQISLLFLFANTLYGASLFLFHKGLNFTVCLGYIYACFLSWKFVLPNGWNCISVSALIIISIGAVSNSFIVMEDSLSAFVFLCLVAFITTGIIIKKIKYKSKVYNFSLRDMLLLCCVIGIFFCVRLSRAFLKCREEQHWCNASSLVHVPLSGLPKELHNARYFTSLLSLFALIFVPQRWLQWCGNLNGGEIGVVITKTFPILCGLLVGGYWALQSVPAMPGNISKIAIYLPQLIYSLTTVGIIVIWYNPLFVYTPSSINNILGSSERSVIPQLFMKLKQTYEPRSPKPRQTPVVYGLATAVSAPLLVLLSLLAIPLIVIAGDGMTPAVLLLVTVASLTAVAHAFFTWHSAETMESLISPNWFAVAMWFLLSIHGFFTTGHQATFPTINWASAFVGYDGSGSYLIPAILVLINTFSSQLLFGLSLPLLLTVPLSVGFLWPSVRPSRIRGEGGNRGEFLLIERPVEAREGLCAMAATYIMFHSVKVFFTSVFAFVLRRHLMTWKIFAPHFVFEAVGLMVSCLGVVVGLTFTLRVLSALEAWSKKL